MNTNTRGELCGDVNFERVVDHVLAITPVPGGVGPMTIISLAQNLLQAAKNRLSL
jgi:methylenetetrahydrofolate dehydrogenase (NADP+)/methenyltetrahydrofolate cyclohydrolase